jgi:hypothetical protein
MKGIVMPSPRTPLLATAVALAAVVAAPAPTVSAAVLATGAYYVQSATTGLNAADSGGAVEQHRPKGDENHQQWTLRASGSSYILVSVDAAGSCLGRSGGQARTVACTSADAAWGITDLDADRYRLKVPGAERYLTVGAKPSGSNYPAQLSVGSASGLAALVPHPGRTTDPPHAFGRPAHLRPGHLPHLPQRPS